MEKTIKSYIGPYTNPYRPYTGRIRTRTDPVPAVYGSLPTRYGPYTDPYRPYTGLTRTFADPMPSVDGALPTLYFLKRFYINAHVNPYHILTDSIT